MSEFSRSLHFWRSSHDAVRALVRKQHAMGRLVATNAHWTCFVPSDPEEEAKVIAGFGALVMKWSYYEDYALGLEFHKSGQKVGDLSFIWGTGLAGEPPGASVPDELCSELVRSEVLTPKDIEELRSIAVEVRAGRGNESEIRDRIAAILHLPAYEWISPETCLEISIESFQEMYPGAEDIEPE